MNALYDKYETDESIEYTFHFMPVVNVLFFLLLIASMAPGGPCSGRIRRASALLLILWMAGLLPIWFELDTAMRSGPATVTGSKFSCANPLRVTIAKKPHPAP